ncbi:hypothetical protein MPLA_250037 [Mesorhizobium sp. ORS 3359]|nr:hypothetical protein MPLA_250037 [Mesorhizobium sp. ORS 3359]
MNITRKGFSPVVALWAGMVPVYDKSETALLKERRMRISARNILKGSPRSSRERPPRMSGSTSAAA